MPLVLIALILVVAIVYVAYVFISYSRIDDNTEIIPEGAAKSAAVKTGEEYTALTYNVGFGAYTPDFTFFMDGGKSSWAESKESVIACIDGAAGVIKEHNADFALIQEVDFNSTRSYHVDEREQLETQFPDCSSAFAINYHSPFLFYPFTQPHGASNSGLLTLSESTITSSLRRSLPISTGVKKLLDLDRCYSISRIPVENGKELIIINLHTSAYGTDGDLQTQQMQMLFDDMKAEYDKGNYVIAGGDWNHDFTGDSKFQLNDATPEDLEALSWCAEFPADMIPEGFARVTDYASGLRPSTRNTDIPYSEDSFVVTLDGFIISDNIESTYVDVIDTGFLYSDHNPVEMRFKLK
ncbi:MAG: endonuclease/exonuclease/phosphatase family protein [Ruminococcus sp.]|nr:endonuclease/exonuclease/phosphatase family protein [Ruminococcus sp.]